MHFFTETSKISAHNSAYGPIDNLKFRVTTRMQLSEAAKVFACASGSIVVQEMEGNASKVNICLKPDATLNLQINPVQFFIYRGIKKTSLLSANGQTIAPAGAGANEFINKLWSDFYDQNTNFTGPLPPPTPDTFGYDNSAAFGSISLEDIFYNPQYALISEKVQEGEWIADFSSGEIGALRCYWNYKCATS